MQHVARVIAVMLALGAPLAAQNAAKVTFDVASVRLVETPTPSMRTITDARVDLLSMPLRSLLTMAFEVENYQLIVPDAIMNQRMWFDIRATLPPGTTRKQVPAMLRSLLEQRLGLVTHVESRPLDVGELTIGPGGLKMKEVEAVDDRDTPLPVRTGGAVPFDIKAGSPDNPTRLVLSPDGMWREITARTNYGWKDTDHGTTVYDATRATLAQLTDMLHVSLGKPVVDRTGLTGLYQFRIEVPRNTAKVAEDLRRAGITTNAKGDPINVDALVAEPVAGSPFKAAESLGLKLEERRLPIDVVVVDTILKEPTAN